MSSIVELTLTPAEAFDAELFKQAVQERLAISPDSSSYFQILKRSIDARSRDVVVRISGEIVDKNKIPLPVSLAERFRDVSNKKRVVIVGAGPAGLFAALRLLNQV